MSARVLPATLVVVLILGCGSETGTVEKPKLAVGEAVRRVVVPVGGSRVGEPSEYGVDDLFEVLDGGAPLYLEYGFSKLVRVRYRVGDDPLAIVTLDVFDMKSRLGAFGVYRSIRPSDALHRDWGAEGYRSGMVAAAWRGDCYVHAEADDSRQELIDATEAVVAQVCGLIPGDVSMPAVLAPLPVDGRLPRSERWVAGSLLGHDFLPGGVVAQYLVVGVGGAVFFSDLGNRAAAAGALGRLRDHYLRYGAVTGELSDLGDGGFSFSDAGLGSGSVVRVGRFVAGAHGELPAEVRGRLLGHLAANLAVSRGQP